MHDAEYGAYETHAYEMVREWQTISRAHGQSNVILYVIRYARLILLLGGASRKELETHALV
jgi:hypothetical protein